MVQIVQIVLAILAVVVISFLFSNKFRYRSKKFFNLFYVFLFATVFIPYGILRPKNVRNYWLIFFFLRNLGRLHRMKFSIKGLENLKEGEAGVIAANHQSELDVITMGYLWPYFGLAAAVMKRSLLFFGPFGPASYLCDSFYVDRSNPTRARATVNNAVDYLVNKKTKLWMFPEGTRNQSGTLLPFKKGAFHMAIQAQVPVLPIVISSYSTFYSTKEKKYDSGGQINIVVLPPVPTKGLTVEDMQMLMDSVRTSMQEAFDLISCLKTDANTNNNGLTCRSPSDK